MTTKIKERPIIFKPEMVQAILDGRKTVTRRIVKHKELVNHKNFWSYVGPKWEEYEFYNHRNSYHQTFKCPFGVPGDRLWVREAWKTLVIRDELKPSELPIPSESRYSPIEYLAGGTNIDYANSLADLGKYRHARFMCRWMSRINLEVVSVGVEKIQSITKGDCIAEGMTGLEDVHAGWHQSYAELWNSINGPDSWDINPWVWRVEFKKLSGQISHVDWSPLRPSVEQWPGLFCPASSKTK